MDDQHDLAAARASPHLDGVGGAPGASPLGPGGSQEEVVAGSRPTHLGYVAARGLRRCATTGPTSISLDGPGPRPGTVVTWRCSVEPLWHPGTGAALRLVAGGAWCRLPAAQSRYADRMCC